MADDQTTFVDRNNMTRHTKCAIRNHKSNQVVLAVDDYYYLAGTQRLLLGFQFLIIFISPFTSHHTATTA